uniref:Uncharacterized protein n=1 Tax=Arundo donax TaxID=35708 RepID=A0A0A9BHZ8_ARUDO
MQRMLLGRQAKCGEFHCIKLWRFLCHQLHHV